MVVCPLCQLCALRLVRPWRPVCPFYFLILGLPGLPPCCSASCLILVAYGLVFARKALAMALFKSVFEMVRDLLSCRRGEKLPFHTCAALLKCVRNGHTQMVRNFLGIARCGGGPGLA